MIAYIDSSVIVRYVLQQPDRLPEVGQLVGRVTSLLSQVECLRVVDRLRLLGHIDDDELAARREAVYRQLARMHRVGISRAVLDRAAGSFPTMLGSLDAIHLATALQWRERRATDLAFATHDRQLGRAAAAMGFTVLGL